VRYHECDAQGIVFNANHFAYFDITLTELWREAFGSYDAVREDYGTDVVVADAQASFHGPVRFDDEIDVHFTIERFGNTSMTARVEEHRNGEVLVSGRMVHVFVDAKTLKKQPIPDHMRDTLSAWADS
jgi:acyl-CoA thioester hydrolase